MRLLRLAIAAPIVALATPAGAALPQLALACSSVPAGQDASCTISRVSGGKGIYVLFQTSDGTAKAGVDYAAVSRQVYLSAGTPSLAIAVHTLINPNATGTLAFNAAVAGGVAVVRTVGSIVEPAPPPPPSPAPTPTPVAQWTLAPLTNGGYARCKAVAGCHSTNAPCPQGLNPPAVCGYPDIVASFGDVWLYAWNGCNATNPCRYIGAFWPIGQYKVAGVGVEGWQDEWEGVVPAP